MTKKNLLDLLGKVRRLAAKNSFYILISYFLSAVITGVVVGFLLSPIILMNRTPVAEGDALNASPLADFLATLPHGVLVVGMFVLLFFALQFYFVMNYGFCNMLFQMQREKFVTIGFLFNGFRKFKKASALSAVYSIVISLVLIIARIFLYFYRNNLSPVIEAAIKNPDEKVELSLVFLLGTVAVALLVAFLILLPFSLAFYCSFDDEKATTKENMKKSRELLKKHKLGFIGFVLASGGTHLVTAIVAWACVYMLSPARGEEKASGALSVFSLIIELIYIFNTYTAFTKMAISVPFYYGHLRFGKKEEAEEATSTSVEVTNAPTVEVTENTEEIATITTETPESENADS